MAVSKRLRYEILRRDNYACRYCGGVAPDAVLTVDHVVPVALGGSDDATNLVAACRDCNAGKSSAAADASLVADVSADAIRWAAAMREAGKAVQTTREQRAVWHEWFEDMWGHYTFGPLNKPVPKPLGWQDSIERFFDAGLTASDLNEAIRKAMGTQKVQAADTFRYFCGICWGMLTDRQEAARAILSAEEDA